MMLLNTDSGSIDWMNTSIAAVGVVSGVSGVVVALFALGQSRRSNALAAKSVEMQERENRVRLIVQPTMRRTASSGANGNPQPVITIINRSAFPVSIDEIAWKTNRAVPEEYRVIIAGFSAAVIDLPVLVESRRRLIVYCHDNSFKSASEFLSIQSVIVRTECGEAFEGMTSQWHEYAAKVRDTGKVHWESPEPTRR